MWQWEYALLLMGLVQGLDVSMLAGLNMGHALRESRHLKWDGCCVRVAWYHQTIFSIEPFSLRPQWVLGCGPAMRCSRQTRILPRFHCSHQHGYLSAIEHARLTLRF